MVVVVMGHIDHGKSTLLDYLRTANVAANEAGGITQAVGAYELERNGQRLTFLDTPGHEAFAAIRERGARLADIAVLVIAGDDGVKPQTREALAAIQASQIPFIIAINKMDKSGANAERVKQELAEENVLVEGYGGTIPAVAVSAKTGAGVDELVELILLSGELAGLNSAGGDAETATTGFVLEARLDPQIGVVATLIIKTGRLAVGDWLVVADQAAKIKILRDFRGQPVKTLAASAPAQVIGPSALPPVGAAFQIYADKKSAGAAAGAFVKKVAAASAGADAADAAKTEITVPLVLKADVSGSLEALKRELYKLAGERVGLKILAAGVGPINENDIKLAGGSPEALILGFRVKAERAALELGEKLRLPVRTFEIIYELSEWLATELERRTPRQEIEEVIGRAKVLKLFGERGGKQVIGGVVQSGLAQTGKTFKIFRRENEIGRGKIAELQEQKLPSKEVVQDHQFGALVESKPAVAAGDILEIFNLVTK